MKLLKDIMEKANPIIAELRIPSRTKKGVRYWVRLYKDSRITCECEAAQYRKTCSHREKAKALWAESHGWRWSL